MDEARKRFRIVVGGPAHSGKSTFTDRLQRACEKELKLDMQSMSYDPWDLSLLVIKGEISEKERQLGKHDIHVTDVDLRKKSFEFGEFSKKHSVVIGDLPGKISDNLNILLAGATHAIILCDKNQSQLIKLWIDKFSEYEIPILAIIVTSMEKENEIIFVSGGLIKGLLINLDRKGGRNYSPAMIELGKLLRRQLQI